MPADRSNEGPMLEAEELLKQALYWRQQAAHPQAVHWRSLYLATAQEYERHAGRQTFLDHNDLN